MTLSTEDLNALVVALADELEARGIAGVTSNAPRPSVSAVEVAEALSVSAQWVRAHARELGGWPLGTGPKPRWRFDLAEAQRASARLAGERSPEPKPAEQRPSQRRRGKRTGASATTAPLLPIRGSARTAGRGQA